MKLSLGQTRVRLILTALALCTMLGSSCVSSNNHPVITSLKAEKDSVVPLGICEVHCVASDVDGDSLTYNWSSSGGTFLDTGMVTTWTAPGMPGTYTITVTVTDGRDGEAVMQLAIDVEDNNSPVIQSLTADLSVVEPGSSTNIECVAYDPDGDELSHLWTKTGGDFSETSVSEKGSIATWTAPEVGQSYFIAVFVDDGRGGEASKVLEIRVKKLG